MHDFVAGACFTGFQARIVLGQETPIHLPRALAVCEKLGNKIVTVDIGYGWRRSILRIYRLCRCGLWRP